MSARTNKSSNKLSNKFSDWSNEFADSFIDLFASRLYSFLAAIIVVGSFFCLASADAQTSQPPDSSNNSSNAIPVDPLHSPRPNPYTQAEIDWYNSHGRIPPFSNLPGPLTYEEDRYIAEHMASSPELKATLFGCIRYPQAVPCARWFDYVASVRKQELKRAEQIAKWYHYYAAKQAQINPFGK